MLNPTHSNMVFDFIKRQKSLKNLNLARITNKVPQHVIEEDDIYTITTSLLCMSIDPFLEHFKKIEPPTSRFQKTINKLNSMAIEDMKFKHVTDGISCYSINFNLMNNLDNKILENFTKECIEYFDNIPHFEKQLILNKVTN